MTEWSRPEGSNDGTWLRLLDSDTHAAFDRLTRLATLTLHVPMSLVSFVGEDRQVFPGAAGLPEPWASCRETPLSHSFCRHEVASGEPLVVGDARENPLLRDNPAITDLGVIAYAGIPLRTPDGQVLGSFCAIDHHPRLWTREELAILADLAAAAMTEIELRMMGREVGRAAERAEHLHAVTAALTGALTPDAVAVVAVEQGVAALGANAGLVALLSPHEETLEIVQAAGYPPHLVELWRHIPLAAPVPLAEAVRTKTPLWFASLAELAARYPALAATVSGFSSDLPLTAIPLVVEERAVGVLGLAFPKARAFGADDRALMLALAGQCAQAIERARLYMAERSARERAERLQAVTAALAEAATREAVAEAALREGIAAVGAVAGGLGVLADGGATFERLAMFGYPEEIVAVTRRPPLDEMGPMATAARTGEVVWLETADELFARYPQLASVPARRRFGGAVAAPIGVGGRTIGVMALRFAGARPFDAAVRDLILAIAGQCAQALERARLYEAEQHARTAAEAAQRRLVFLTRAGAILSASLDYETTLNNVIQLVMPTLADFGFFDVVESDGQVRRIVRAYEDPRRQAILEPTRWVRSERTDLNLCALSSGLPGFHPEIDDAWLVDIAVGPEHLALLRQLAFHSMITVPLLARGERLGALTLFYADSGRRHTGDDLALAEELAHRAASAVDNARLYRQAREAVQLREQFVSIASHELKTPLTSLVGFMQLLQRQLDRPVPDHERFRRYVAQCRQQTDRLRSLVDDLLIASRSQQGRLDLRPERFDLVALAVEIAERCAYMPERTAEHRLVLEAPAPVEGTWDRDRLDQVLTNLVSNALKYSPAGGTVLVRVERRDEEVEVTVGDEGLGISPEEQGALFQPFVRAAATNEQVGGTGLGLYIVRQIVEAHGGSAALESAVGKGTTVTVRLPLAVRGGAADGMAPAVS